MRFYKFYIIFTTLLSVISSAQDTSTTSVIYDEGSFLNRDKNWELTIPVWIPGFRGNFTYGDISLEGEDGTDPGDPTDPPEGGGNIFSRLFNSSSFLKFFFMGRVAYSSDKFIIELDSFSGRVGNRVEFTLNNKEIATAEFFSLLTRLIAGYSFYEFENKSHSLRLTAYGYTGLRVHYIELTSNLNRTVRSLNLNKSWGEVLFGLKSRLALNDWMFRLQGDISGFNKNSNFSYMLQAVCAYRLSNLLSIKLGWTDWDVKYRGNVKDEELTLNVHLSGPNMGLTFHL
jgi:hypothetical protein